MKFAIIGFYYMIESFRSVSEILKKLGYEVDFFPMMHYVHNKKDELEQDFNSFLSGKSVDDKIIVSSANKIDVVIWWFYESVPVNIFSFVKNVEAINLLYNWNDPYETTEDRIKNNNLDKISKYLDIVFTTSKNSIEIYKSFGINYAYHITPGFNPKIHYKIDKLDKMDKSDYECDVSFIVNQLYENNLGGIDRKILLNKITKIPNIKVNIYGPAGHLKSLYPENYVEEVKHENSHKIFNRSKININTHRMNNNDGYFNERLFQILGSGGLMLCDIDPIKNEYFNLNENDYVKFDPKNLNNIEETIMKILDNYDEYSEIKKNGYENVTANGQWFNVINYILSKLKLHFFRKNNVLNYNLKSINSDISEINDQYNVISEINGLLKLISLDNDFRYHGYNQIKSLVSKNNLDMNKILEQYVYKQRKLELLV